MSTDRTTVRAFSRAADVPRAPWAALLRPEDLYLGERWLAVAERTAGCPMRYLTLDDGEGRSVAGLATALAGDDAPWVLGRPDTLLEFSAKDGREGAAEILAGLPAGPAESLLPALVCGGRHMGRSRVPRLPGTGRAEVEALVAEAERHAAEQGAASVAYPFVEEGDTLLRQVLADRGYLCHESGRYSSLRVGEGGFEDYLGLVSARRRRRILTERRRIQEAGIELRIEPLSAGIVPRLGELEAQLMAKYGVAWTAGQTEQVLHEMLAAFGTDAQVVLAVGDGDVRGFATLLQFGNHWYARQGGFDYAYQDRLPLYFETVYYFPVEAAARRGIEAIHYGLGSEEAKLSRGCTAESQYSYLLPLARPSRNTHG
ncbi:GNAT family N-acetyltransferase [Streptomyces populi]|uniref:GNAT family N-acetyltransferase n=1 Tax=Streptomyces populi TaxID=2058924 RepID=A0A2I0SHD3_9ACTN|nr:GNAT family N-acetyltransferase [Streptomyces populi]PKT69321.1 GNAT family N-acetyltransferase [Streptomyces populi]